MTEILVAATNEKLMGPRGPVPNMPEPSRTRGHLLRRVPGGKERERIVRHPGDVVRIAVGAVSLAGLSVVARQDRLSAAETDVFRLVNDLPAQLEMPLRVTMQAGSLGAVPVAAVAALLARKPKLARNLALAGGLSWLAARGLKDVVGRGRPGTLLHGVIFRGGLDTGLGFPSGHAAVAAALVATVSPYLGVKGRRAAWSACAAVGVARIYVGAHLPVDVIGGAVLGWTIAAVIRLLFGTPQGSTTAEAVAEGLAEVEQGPFDVTPAAVDARGSSPFAVVTGNGNRVFVKAISQVQRDADLAFKAWRLATRRQLEDEAPFATPKQQAEHEAFVGLLARRAGVNTPAFRAVTTHGPHTLLVFDHVTGRPLDRVDVSDSILDAAWRQVALLRSAGIAHRDLRLANLIVGDDGSPWLVDFGFAEASASDHRLAQDAAELLASSAVAVGSERAIAAALRVLAPADLSPAVPLLQPLALSSATRKAIHAQPGLLSKLRTGTSTATGLDDPSIEPLARLRPRTILLLAGGLFAIHLLLPQVGQLKTTIATLGTVQPGWLVIAAVASLGTYLAAGLAQVGAVPNPISYLRTTEAQIAATFANRISPASVGGIGVNVRYLQRSGIAQSDAWAAVALNTTAGGVIHVVMLLAAAIAVGRQGVRFVHLPPGFELLLGALVALVIAGVALWSPLGRRRIIPPIRQGAMSIGAVLKRPSKAAQLFGGSALITVLYVVALVASLEAFHSPLPILQVTLVYLGAAAVAAVAPTPGGLGAMEAALVAGLTALGAPPGPAIAGVLAYRLLTYWAPIVPGWLVFRRLTHRQLL